MSGRKQHFIPKEILRGFLTIHTGRTEKVWVYEKDGKHFVSALEGVAAQRDFYSPPSIDGSKTLDDIITDYEDRLKLLICDLRKIPVRASANAGVAAEVIAHLTPRSKHVRGVFAHGMEFFATKAKTALLDEENVARLIGLNNDAPNDRFRELMSGALTTNPEFQILDELNLPPEILEKVLFTGLQEGFGEFFAQQSPHLVSALNQFSESIGETIKLSHKKALSKAVVSESRRHDLGSFSWRVLRGPAEGAILPDCVALALDHDGTILPYIMTGLDNTDAVIMPLTSENILVGQRDSALSIDLTDFNRNAAECSHDFFVTSSQSDSYLARSKAIGARSTSEIEQAVSDALEIPTTIATDDTDEPEPKSPAKAELSSPRYQNFQVEFRDCADEESGQRIAGVVKYIVSEFSRITSLERLDGITFAYDYPAALNELDRGFSTALPPKTVGAELGIGIAQAPIVVRDGVKKVRLVVREEYAHALVGDDSAATGFALHVIVEQLGEAAFIEMLDIAFPDFLLCPYADQHVGALHVGVHPAIVSYFAARTSAGFGADDVFESHAREIALGALDCLQAAITKAKESYAADNDVCTLLKASVAAVADVLAACGRVAGQRHGVGRSLGVDADPLDAALRERGLHNWFESFQRDLDILWCRRRAWSSLDEFLAQTKHVERLLWPFGIFPWKKADGSTYVRVILPLPEVKK